MSSILMALKKLEQESSGKGAEGEARSSVFNKIDTRKTVKRRAKGALLVSRIHTIVLMILVVGLSGWLLWIYKPFLGVTTSPQPLPSPAATEEGKAAPLPSPPSPAGKEPSAAVPGPGQSQSAALPETKTEDSAETRIDPAHPKAPARREKPQTEEAVSVKQSVPTGRTDEAKYKLEAIVWSAKEESRFAVINGQIVRAGESVGDLSVKEIGREYVAVRSQNRDWKLGFTVE